MYVAGIKVFYRGGILKQRDNISFRFAQSHASVLSKARGLFPTDRCREMYVAGIKVFYRGGILKRKDNVNFQAVRGYASVLSKAAGKIMHVNR